jgi:hypothetical protein
LELPGDPLRDQGAEGIAVTERRGRAYAQLRVGLPRLSDESWQILFQVPALRQEKQADQNVIASGGGKPRNAILKTRLHTFQVGEFDGRGRRGLAHFHGEPLKGYCPIWIGGAVGEEK